MQFDFTYVRLYDILWSVAAKWIWKWGGTGLPEKNLLVVPLHAPFGFKITISCFCERFRGGQYSLVCFLFAVPLLTVPPPCPVPSHL